MMAYAVDRWGNRGDRIVLVHGSLGVGAAAFGEQKVLEDRFTLDVMTRRGYGGTPAIERVDIHRDASDLIELLGEGAHLVGTSTHWGEADPADLRNFVIGFVAALEMDMPMPDPLPAPVAAAAVNLVTERPWKVDVPAGAIADAPYPKMVVTGGWSKAFDAISRRLAELLECELHVLTGAGHAVQKVGAPFNDRLERLVSA